VAWYRDGRRGRPVWTRTVPCVLRANTICNARDGDWYVARVAVAVLATLHSYRHIGTGLFPDVGVSYTLCNIGELEVRFVLDPPTSGYFDDVFHLLRQHLPLVQIGKYIALTGVRLNAADLMWTGLVRVQCHHCTYHALCLILLITLGNTLLQCAVDAKSPQRHHRPSRSVSNSDVFAMRPPSLLGSLIVTVDLRLRVAGRRPRCGGSSTQAK